MTLSELIKALETADGPSLHMDGVLWCVANGYEFIEWNTTGCVYRGGSDNRVYRADSTTVRPYTASVDAAIALCERVLPGWRLGITQGDDDENSIDFQGNVWPGEQPFLLELEQYGYHKMPAIALCIAILRARLSQDGGGDE
jgi:hypothetical protein